MSGREGVVLLLWLFRTMSSLVFGMTGREGKIRLSHVALLRLDECTYRLIRIISVHAWHEARTILFWRYSSVLNETLHQSYKLSRLFCMHPMSSI